MSLEFRAIAHAYDGAPVLSDLSLQAASGETLCLLGPSGCGKTTLLRLAAGLTPVQAGEIWLGGETLASRSVNPPPEARPVGLVFQEGALFPHLTVADNVGFALNGGTDQRSTIVSGLLDRVGLAGFDARYPHTLSGGQQQRVALARALAAEPRVMLLDEPFASIDITLRRQLREDMRLVLKEAGVITILVTHDPDEALDMADRIAVLEQGRVAQVGLPEALFDAPASPGVAALIGGAQHVSANISDTGVRTPFGELSLSAIRGEAPRGDALLMVRPAAGALGPGGQCRVADVRSTGEWGAHHHCCAER